MKVLEINIPRDRNGEFEPKIIPKHQRSVNGIEEKILGLYATGMTTRDGLMSIFWTQKVKLFYAALLANNSHCSGVM